MNDYFAEIYKLCQDHIILPGKNYHTSTMAMQITPHAQGNHPFLT